MDRPRRGPLTQALSRGIPLLLFSFLCRFPGPAFSEEAGEPAPVRVLVVTGGHDFSPRFYDLFEGQPEIAYRKAEHPHAFAELEPERAGAFDVLVLYDMYQGETTPRERDDFVALLRQGKGLVILHHALASHPGWPEYARIAGGRYLVRPERTGSGETLPASTYRHDVEFRVEVADPAHPIALGLDDFDLFDETYGGFLVDPGVHQLLRTEHPTSGRVIGWCHRYLAARVVTLEPGHGPEAYAHPAYRRLVQRSVLWAAGRLADGGEAGGYRELFNHRDLAGWKAAGEGVWEVRDGILVGRPGPGATGGDLLTEDTFGDFDLQVTYRVRWPANSGVWFRYQSAERAYQADILEWPDPRCWSGTIYCPGKMFLALNTDPTTVRREGWNTLRVRARGPRLAVDLNGCRVAEAADPAVPSGRVGLQVHGGGPFSSMQLEVRDVRIRPPEDHSADEALLEEAPARIERHRKGPLVVHVVDAAGQPLAGAEVTIRQECHEFLFGCNIFLHGRLEPPADEEVYRSRFAALFNYATLPFYWRGYEGEQGKPQHADRERVALWCREQGIATKGHPLVWNHPASVPEWLAGSSGEIQALSDARVEECVRRFAGLVDRWDVVNEATDPWRFDGSNVMTRAMREAGVLPWTVSAFLAARRAAPRAVLLINDYRVDEAYEELIRGLQHEGKPVYDAIGIQSHMHGGGWSSARVWEVCERFSRFGRPLHFTETTVVSGRRRDGGGWGPSEPELEEAQAEAVARFYTMLFSHPAVEAITWWDFADRGAWQRAPAGFLRRDLSPKPAYRRLLELVRRRWWTSEEARTDGAGRVRLRAFFGSYEIEARKEGRHAAVRPEHRRGAGVTEVRVAL